MTDWLLLVSSLETYNLSADTVKTPRIKAGLILDLHDLKHLALVNRRLVRIFKGTQEARS